MYSVIRSNARLAVRTRSIGVISRSSARIGLIFSAPPIQLCAAPTRPPRRRYSSVSTQNHIRRPSRARRAASATSSREAPSEAARAAASTARPRPPQPVSESRTSILSGAAEAARACWADAMVPDSPAERWIDTMSRPSASSGS